jgi:hypothetical protein
MNVLMNNIFNISSMDRIDDLEERCHYRNRKR